MFVWIGGGNLNGLEQDDDDADADADADDDHGDHVFSVKVYFVELYFWGGVSWAQTSSPQRLNMATASSEL